jgi:ABC-type uncharacterized transport system involved in gliding motility auxiliary subunit
VTPVAGSTSGRTAQPVVETGPKSWAKVDLKQVLAGGEMPIDEAKGDKPGPITIAAAASAAVAASPDQTLPKPDAPRNETRVVVVGDSDFVANFIAGFQGNRDLFMNMVNWLAQQENLIAIRPREPEDRRVTLTADQQRRIMLLTLVLIPLAIIGAGVYSWWRRR